MEIPLILKLKKQSYKEIAQAQDKVVEEIYKVFNRAVIHGETAIWRCYQGNRFSEDIDIYVPRIVEKINLLFANLKNQGFIIEKKKIGENSLYSSLKLGNTIVRVEALFKNVRGILKEYEKTNGNFSTIYTLTAEELIKEKIRAYQNRKKVRDIYDIFFLLRHVKDKKKISGELNKFIGDFKKPIDENALRALIFEGIAPNVEEMLGYIKREI